MKEFIFGTSFPDIRYLKVVSRTETHFTNVSLQDILQEKNSFKAGMVFHSFVDERREAYVVENHFYKKIPNFKFSSQSLKFAEDEILKSYLDIFKYHAYFDAILAIGKAYASYKMKIIYELGIHFCRIILKAIIRNKNLLFNVLVVMNLMHVFMLKKCNRLYRLLLIMST